MYKCGSRYTCQIEGTKACTSGLAPDPQLNRQSRSTKSHAQNFARRRGQQVLERRYGSPSDALGIGPTDGTLGRPRQVAATAANVMMRSTGMINNRSTRIGATTDFIKSTSGSHRWRIRSMLPPPLQLRHGGHWRESATNGGPKQPYRTLAETQRQDGWPTPRTE